MLDKITDVVEAVVPDKNSKSGRLIVLRVISFIGYLALLFVLILPLISVTGETEGSLSHGLGLALYLIIFVLIGGGVCTLISTVCSVIGLFVTLDKREPGTKKGQIAFFIIMSLLPLVTEIAFYFVTKTMLP